MKKTSKKKKRIVKKKSDSKVTNFPIVGIGASAGGLEAYVDFFKRMPDDTGSAFVLVQHLSPTHESMLAAILQRSTQMPVIEIEDGMKVEPNKIYVIPPNSVLEILNGILSLRSMTKQESTNRLVDTFLSSLARDHSNLAVGVVLSGTGSDGSQGICEIKAAGGISLVQDPPTAKFDGMPKMAIKIDHPDRILSVAGIVDEIVRIAKNPRFKKLLIVDPEKLAPDDEGHLRKIFLAVRSKTGTDFSVYKHPTILRRLKRRMLLNSMDSMKDYLSLLLSSPEEVQALFQDFIINVTYFFRGPEVFEYLQSKVFPEIIKNHAEDLQIRIWVPGCSTGEEVYTIAIGLLECLQKSKTKYAIKIYGTDVGDEIIKKARTGLFSKGIEKHVSKDRLDRFFTRDNDQYRINKVVRDCCIFSVQDVTTDPPIHRLDLLSCRNLIIYLSASAQKNLMQTFYYALNPNGFLLLGSSESVGSASSYFSVADERNKVFLKRVSAIPPKRSSFRSQRFGDSEVLSGAVQIQNDNSTELQTDIVAKAEKLVLEYYAPAWILVNQVMDIVHFNGQMTPFIKPRTGQASLHIAKMLREELVSDVRVLIHKLEKEKGSVNKNNIAIVIGKVTYVIDVKAVLVETDSSSHHFLILFHERLQTLDLRKEPIKNNNSDMIRLQEELDSTKKSLRTLLDEQSAANEELQSSNEEILSANEELQSTNEELETAKEELQSTNEELVTVNEELSQSNIELKLTNDDLSNLLSSASAAVAMVNADLFIRRLTPGACKLLNLSSDDLGRRITDFSLGFLMPNFEEMLNDVIQNITTLEFETQDLRGQHFYVSIRPFKTHDRKVDGAVIIFSDIELLKKEEQISHAILETMHDPLIVMDRHLTVKSVNAAFYKTFHSNPEETVGRSLFDLGNGQWNIPKLRDLVQEILPRKTEVRDFEVRHKFSTIGQRTMLVNAQQLVWEQNGESLILLAIRDITHLQNEEKEN